MTFIGILQGEIASLNGILKVENYDIACYLFNCYLLIYLFIAKTLEKPSFKRPCFNEVHSFDNNFKHSIKVTTEVLRSQRLTRY